MCLRRHRVKHHHQHHYATAARSSSSSRSSLVVVHNTTQCRHKCEMTGDKTLQNTTTKNTKPIETIAVLVAMEAEAAPLVSLLGLKPCPKSHRHAPLPSVVRSGAMTTIPSSSSSSSRENDDDDDDDDDDGGVRIPAKHSGCGSPGSSVVGCSVVV